MAAGYLFNGVCHTSLSSVADAFFSSIPPAVHSGSPSYLSVYSTQGPGLWQVATYDTSVNGAMTFVSYADVWAPDFPICDTYDTPDAFGDGMLLGWGVVAAIALAWAFTAMRKGL